MISDDIMNVIFDELNLTKIDFIRLLSVNRHFNELIKEYIIQKLKL